MAIKSRLLGRDVQIRIAQGGAPLTTITAVKNFTFETRQRILTENYLGETQARQDSVAEEVGGSFTIHLEDPEVQTFQKFLYDKAIKRQQGEDQVTIVFRTTYPNGKVTKVTIPEVEFDPVPFTVGGRDAYVEQAYTYKAERFSYTS